MQEALNKKIIALFCITAVFLTSCGDRKNSSSESKKPVESVSQTATENEEDNMINTIKEILDCNDNVAKNIYNDLKDAIPGKISSIESKPQRATPGLQVKCTNGKEYLAVIGLDETVISIYEGDSSGKRIYYIMR